MKDEAKNENSNLEKVSKESINLTPLGSKIIRNKTDSEKMIEDAMYAPVSPFLS